MVQAFYGANREIYTINLKKYIPVGPRIQFLGILKKIAMDMNKCISLRIIITSLFIMLKTRNNPDVQPQGWLNTCSSLLVCSGHRHYKLFWKRSVTQEDIFLMFASVLLREKQ